MVRNSFAGGLVLLVWLAILGSPTQAQTASTATTGSVCPPFVAGSESACCVNSTCVICSCDDCAGGNGIFHAGSNCSTITCDENGSGVATTGVATTGVATTGVATTGYTCPPFVPGSESACCKNDTCVTCACGDCLLGGGQYFAGLPCNGYECPSPTTGVATTGVATTGVATTGVATTGVATTGVATTGYTCPPFVPGSESACCKNDTCVTCACEDCLFGGGQYFAGLPCNGYECPSPTSGSCCYTCAAGAFSFVLCNQASSETECNSMYATSNCAKEGGVPEVLFQLGGTCPSSSACPASPTTAVGTTGVGTTAVGTTAVGTTGVGTTAVGTTAVGTTGVGTTAVGTTGVGTTGVGTTAVGTTGVGTTGVGTTAVGTTGVGTTGVIQQGPGSCCGTCNGGSALTWCLDSVASHSECDDIALSIRNLHNIAGYCNGSFTADGECSSDCAENRACGNGVKETDETCDDGNYVVGDGCSDACQIEHLDRDYTCGTGCLAGTVVSASVPLLHTDTITYSFAKTPLALVSNSENEQERCAVSHFVLFNIPSCTSVVSVTSDPPSCLLGTTEPCNDAGHPKCGKIGYCSNDFSDLVERPFKVDIVGNACDITIKFAHPLVFQEASFGLKGGTECSDCTTLVPKTCYVPPVVQPQAVCTWDWGDGTCSGVYNYLVDGIAIIPKGATNYVTPQPTIDDNTPWVFDEAIAWRGVSVKWACEQAWRVWRVDGESANATVSNLTHCPDCNGNGLPDPIEIEQGAVPDCNSNGIPDVCDIEENPNVDANTNGIPDSCELNLQNDLHTVSSNVVNILVIIFASACVVICCCALFVSPNRSRPAYHKTKHAKSDAENTPLVPESNKSTKLRRR